MSSIRILQFEVNIKNFITSAHFYAIPCTQKSVLSYLSISTLSSVQCTCVVNVMGKIGKVSKDQSFGAVLIKT